MDIKLRILTVGDVVGVGGTEYIRKNLWSIRKQYNIDFTVLNGENAAKGNGLDKDTAEALIASGADVITSGNHIWNKHEMRHYIENNELVLRPANYPALCPGEGYHISDVSGTRVLVISLIGNVYMYDSFYSPFEAADDIIKKRADEYDIAVIDFHAEATSEKAALAKYLDGRISVLFGTHTHVQTSDIKILPSGTGFITDVGMTGAYDSVIGVKNECVLEKFLTKMPVRFEEAGGRMMFNAAWFDVDEKTHKTVDAKAINIIEA